MADAVATVIGAAIMIAFLAIIAGTLNELPLAVACIIGVALMLWGFWTDVFAPLLRREGRKL
jgi:predicted CDP-diglyceride synthetase/phosphatidate cytidylyltransferase